MIDSIVYIAVGAVGIADPRVFALLFSSIRSVPADEWQPEPRGNLDVQTAPGEILYSAILSAETQEELLNEFP